MDGEPNRRIKCTLANWTGVAYKVPRTELDKCRGRDDLSQSGVYFLIGISNQSGENIAYIGQAGVRKNGEGILYRLQEHSKRYAIKNGNDPSPGNITEEKESELEEFIDYAKIVMGTLGHKVFEPLADVKPIIEVNSEVVPESGGLLLHMKRKSRKSGQTMEEECKQTAEGFVVLRGSHIKLNDSDSIPPGIKEARQKAKIDSDGVLQEDVLFKSPSYATAFVVGGHANGLAEWKSDGGKTLKDIENSSTI